jgi:hypothetical protein
MNGRMLYGAPDGLENRIMSQTDDVYMRDLYCLHPRVPEGIANYCTCQEC